MRSNNTAAYYTLGCKLNFAETSTIARDLEDAGFAKVPFDQMADLYVINTCSVTDNADKKCRNIVRKALNNNPEAFVVVVGCYAQLKPVEISQIEGVDLVLGAKEKFNISSFIEDLSKNETTLIHRDRIRETKDFISSWSAGGRTRSFLKVQDGCDYFCSFCTIPIARGKSRSATTNDVVSNANAIASKGIKEIVLTGVNIGDFKNDLNENFLDLIVALDNVEGIDRFRISSIEPNLLDEEIIDFVGASKRFMPHFHIPLQSGSDILLKSMRRKYDVALYESRVKYIMQKMPHACIGVDVIVGYPGETDDEFLKTYNFLLNLDVSYLHVFTYSERNNTLAKKLDGVVEHS
ncbi:MAG: threonylcarbamoyladenosine tRNA methylthiotransferase MtaB, partial [Urechidicola sp.]